MDDRIAGYRCPRCADSALASRGRPSILDGERFWSCPRCGLAFGTPRTRLQLLGYLLLFAVPVAVLVLVAAANDSPAARLGAAAAGVAVLGVGLALVVPDLLARRPRPLSDAGAWSDVAFVLLDLDWRWLNPLQLLRPLARGLTPSREGLGDMGRALAFGLCVFVPVGLIRDCEQRESLRRSLQEARPQPASPTQPPVLPGGSGARGQ